MSLYIILAGVVTFVAIVSMRETRHLDLSVDYTGRASAAPVATHVPEAEGRTL